MPDVNLPDSPFDLLIGTEWIDHNPDKAIARLAMRDEHRQPMGIMHGGVMSSLVESLCSMATARAVVPENRIAMGQSISTNLLRPVSEGGIEVEYNGMKSFIRRSDLSRDRADQRPERFQVGDHVDVRVTNIDPKTRKLGLSIKAREIAEEKEAVEQYGSSDSGASLGDILGAALKDRG